MHSGKKCSIRESVFPLYIFFLNPEYVAARSAAKSKWMNEWMINRQTQRLADGQTDRQTDRQTDWQTVCLSVCLSVCLTVWLSDWMTEWLNEWNGMGQKDRYTNVLMDRQIDEWMNINSFFLGSFFNLITARRKEGKGAGVWISFKPPLVLGTDSQHNYNMMTLVKQVKVNHKNLTKRKAK